MTNEPLGTTGVAAAAPRAGPHSFCLDLLRALAAQLVLMGHCADLMMVQGQDVAPSRRGLFLVLGHMSSYSHEAVVVFFVLSGFLIGGEVWARVNSGSFAPGPYAVNRLMRLYSVVVPGLLLSAVLDSVSLRVGAGRAVMAANTQFWPATWSDLASLSHGTLLCNLAFLQTIECRQFGINSSLWSLSNEAFYYALFPSLLLLRSSRLRVRLVAACMLAALLIEILRSGSSGDLQRPWIYLFGFVIWLLGAGYSALSARLPPRIGGSVALIVALTLVVLSRVLDLNLAIRDLCLCPLVLWLIHNAELLGTALQRLPRLLRRLIAVMANCSFSLYFLHLPLLFSLMSWVPALIQRRPYDAPGSARFTAIVLLINLFCWGFYWVFERHYRRYQQWGRSLLPQRLRAVVAGFEGSPDAARCGSGA